ARGGPRGFGGNGFPPRSGGSGGRPPELLFLPNYSGSELAATRVRTARSATDKVVKVKRSLSQISPRVCAAMPTAASLREAQVASRSSGDRASPLAPST